MTAPSTYTAHVRARNREDARDIARRRAWDDGYRTLAMRRVTNTTGAGADGLVGYAVELAVAPRPVP